MNLPRALRPYTIPGPAGSLEVIYRPTRHHPAVGAALVCHPHPQFGGTMHSRVVHHLARAFGDAGFVTLRMNFRGVEGSAGKYSQGVGEVDDVLAALDHLRRMHGELSMGIAGHSFGAWVGLRAMSVRPEVEFGVAAGLPVAIYDFSFLCESERPLLVVQGDGDRFGSEETLRTAAASWTRQVQLAIVPGADHFFAQQLPSLRRRVVGFLRDLQ